MTGPTLTFTLPIKSSPSRPVSCAPGITATTSRDRSVRPTPVRSARYGELVVDLHLSPFERSRRTQPRIGCRSSVRLRQSPSLASAGPDARRSVHAEGDSAATQSIVSAIPGGLSRSSRWRGRRTPLSHRSARRSRRARCAAGSRQRGSASGNRSSGRDSGAAARRAGRGCGSRSSTTIGGASAVKVPELGNGHRGLAEELEQQRLESSSARSISSISSTGGSGPR